MLSWKLKELRKANKLSQSELGEALSVSQQTIAGWENNRSEPDIKMIIKIANYFKISTDYLLTNENNKESKPVISIDTNALTTDDVDAITNFVNYLHFKNSKKMN